MSTDEIECHATPPDGSACADERSLGASYTYLLGLYLGDGMLSSSRRNVWKLRITLDAKYPGIIDRERLAMSKVSGRAAPARSMSARSGSSLGRPPSSGPTQLRSRGGLIHSDGCRCLNHVKGHAYPRYFFSNVSSDIRGLFVWACDLVGVESRPSNARNIAVSRRSSVAILDELVGPKA